MLCGNIEAEKAIPTRPVFLARISYNTCCF